MNWLKPILIALAIGAIGLLIGFAWIDSQQETSVLTKEIRTNSGKQYLDLSTGKTAYRITNKKANNPKLLLIHGGGITGDHVFSHQIRALSESGYEVISYDLLGRGYSDRPDIDYTSKALASQLSELLDSLEIKSLHGIIAMSMGASVALEYISTSNSAPKHLILIDPAASGVYRPNALLKIPLLSKILMTFYWYPRALENQRVEFVNMDIFEDYSDQLAYFMDFKGYKMVNYSSWMNILQENKMEYLENLQGKTTVSIIYGEKDPYFSKAELNKYLEIDGSIKHFEILNTGHMPAYEKPTEVNNILKKLLID